VQNWFHMIGAILVPAGVAVVLVVGSLIVVVAMVLFTVVVFRTSRA
jgi:hypothetical protein